MSKAFLIFSRDVEAYRCFLDHSVGYTPGPDFPILEPSDFEEGF